MIISDVFVNDNREVGLPYHMLSTVSYSTHFHAYEVRRVSKKKFLSVTDSLDYHPVLFNKARNGKSYVILHHLL